MYGSFFADEGVFVSGFGDAVGPEAVADALDQVCPFIQNRRHIAANTVISGEGDRAVITTYLIVFERVAALDFVGSAVSIDTMGRHDGEWKIVRHESTLDPATADFINSLMSGERAQNSD
jgi:SnoaL-like domain